MRDNLNLATCEIQSICNYLLAPGGEVWIEDNDTGCNSQQEVEEACGITLLEEPDNFPVVQLYPNPATNLFNISADGFTLDEVVIYNITGQESLKQSPAETYIDISTFQPGMYIVEVTVENRKIRQKLLVQR